MYNELNTNSVSSTGIVLLLALFSVHHCKLTTQYRISGHYTYYDEQLPKSSTSSSITSNRINFTIIKDKLFKLFLK